MKFGSLYEESAPNTKSPFQINRNHHIFIFPVTKFTCVNFQFSEPFTHKNLHSSCIICPGGLTSNPVHSHSPIYARLRVAHTYAINGGLRTMSSSEQNTMPSFLPFKQYLCSVLAFDKTCSVAQIS